MEIKYTALEIDEGKKLKDKGIPNIHGKGRGNIEYTVQVDIPKRLKISSGG